MKKNVFFVGTRTGVVYAIDDRENKAEVITIKTGLQDGNGVAYYNGSLYVGDLTSILKFENIIDNLKSPGEPVVIYDQFPSERAHGARYIGFGPDGNLYVSVGVPCNICNVTNPYGTIMRFTFFGKNLTRVATFASGIRNSVGFDWHPYTKQMWFTDNGRDHISDDLPPDELNCAPGVGLNFGFPYCFGNNHPDPQYNQGKTCAVTTFTGARQELGAHAASLGVRFLQGSMFPAYYRNGVFIAEHGSWNKAIGHSGYQISFVKFAPDNRTTISYTPFATGFYDSGAQGCGRPVDIAWKADGSMIFSDDKSGKVLRITYQK